MMPQTVKNGKKSRNKLQRNLTQKLELLVKELCDAFDIERKQTRHGRLE
jgi:hypothetical protein